MGSLHIAEKKQTGTHEALQAYSRLSQLLEWNIALSDIALGFLKRRTQRGILNYCFGTFSIREQNEK